jgi:ribose transport system substrate-binding protein
MKRRLLLAFALASAVPVLGAASLAQEAPASAPYIPVIVKDASAYYWQIVLAGAQAAATEFGVRIEGQSGNSEEDVAGQISLLEKAIADGATSIVVAPTQYDELGPAVDAAAARIPVIVIDSEVNSLTMKSTLATDNVASGGMAADALATLIEADARSGNIAIVNFLEGAGSLDARSKGFKDQIFAQHPNLTVVDEVYGSGSNDSVETVIEGLLDKHADLGGIFASNLNTSEIAARLVIAAGRKQQISIIGFDSNETLVEYLRDGSIDGLIVQDPYGMGYQGVQSALEAASGRGVLEHVDTGAHLITQDNLDGARETELLNPPLN